MKEHPSILKLRQHLFFGAITIILIAFSSSCSRIDNEELSKYWWLFGSGYHQGDILRFDHKKPLDYENKAWISGDTIYYNNIPEMIVTGTLKKWDGHVNLYVKSIASGESGNYHRKGLK